MPSTCTSTLDSGEDSLERSIGDPAGGLGGIVDRKSAGGSDIGRDSMAGAFETA